jgi:hypothetical protein
MIKNLVKRVFHDIDGTERDRGDSTDYAIIDLSTYKLEV